ncbi:hypothetical protein IAQ61_010499 [Plenodomus lingam]|uniref:uncharacterized protein n=1 Tax=Leptosphaeria maculans TaxID=5022 RepID=UPI0033208B33|nr:hypothetical protein IAQ61_010499 [Plenodomus lingam]
MSVDEKRDYQMPTVDLCQCHGLMAFLWAASTFVLLIGLAHAQSTPLLYIPQPGKFGPAPPPGTDYGSAASPLSSSKIKLLCPND